MTLMIDASVRITLLALAIWLIITVTRVRSARKQHVAWTAVMLLMLVMPLAVRLPLHVNAPVLSASSHDVPQAESRFIDRAPSTWLSIASQTDSPTRTTALGVGSVYVAGVAFLMLRLLAGTAAVMRLRRQAVACDGHMVHPACTAPMTVGWWNPAIIVPATWSRWSPGRQTVVMLHERGHVQRRDPLVQWIAQLNRAIFWFHPLAWWVERQLAQLAETVCDEIVLGHGEDAEAYAGHLLAIARTARRHQRVGPVMGMPGPALAGRIRAILTYQAVPHMPRRTVTAALAAGVVVTLVCVCVTPTRAQVAASFDVASVLEEEMPRNYVRTQVTGHTFVAEGANAGILIRYAYDLKDFQLTGGPAWLYDRDTQFNIHATFAGDGTSERVRAMVRALLAERFALKVHPGRKPDSIFELSVARSGAKLAPTKGDNPTRRGCSPYPAACTDVSMADVADYLSAVVLSEVVIDKTGLDGRYDLQVRWAPDNSQFRGNGGRGFFSGDGPSLFTALQEQVGLQLKATKGDVPILIVDAVSLPSAN